MLFERESCSTSEFAFHCSDECLISSRVFVRLNLSQSSRRSFLVTVKVLYAKFYYDNKNM